MFELRKLTNNELGSVDQLLYNNQPVMLSKQVAQYYRCEEDRIRKNYNSNKEEYKEGIDFFIVEGDELKALKAVISTMSEKETSSNYLRINKIYLWTESGTLLHAKSLNTSRAWSIYKKLVKIYFKVKNAMPQNEIEMAEKLVEYTQKFIDTKKQLMTAKKKIIDDKPKVEAYDRFISSADSISLAAAARVINLSPFDKFVYIGEMLLCAFLRDVGYLMDGRKKNGIHNLPISDKRIMRFFDVKVETIDIKNIKKNVCTTYVTPYGLSRFNTDKFIMKYIAWFFDVKKLYSNKSRVSKLYSLIKYLGDKNNLSKLESEVFSILNEFRLEYESGDINN